MIFGSCNVSKAGQALGFSLIMYTGDPRYSLIFGGKRNPQILKSAEIGDCFSTKSVKWGKNFFKVHFFRFLPT